jgi:uncharacterized membrane protein (UPF0127 family)
MSSPTSAAPTTTTSPTTTSTIAPLDDLDRIEVTVGGEVWIVAVADTPALRARGLMGVTDLGALDGMLFVWSEDVTGGFWMKDTLIPLDIAFFSADGSLVDVLSMVPCEEDPCPSYRPSGPYRMAIEVETGGFVGMAEFVLSVP